MADILVDDGAAALSPQAVLEQIAEREDGEGGLAVRTPLGLAVEAHALHIRGFQEMLGMPGWEGGDFPVIGVANNDFNEPVPLDLRNPYSVSAAHKLHSDRPEETFPLGAYRSPEAWRRIADRSTTIELRPAREVAATFFGLLAMSVSEALSGLLQRHSRHIKFTVDSQNSGYQLQYWPQYYFSPQVFGGNLTRPVTAHVARNVYCFMGTNRKGRVVYDQAAHRCDDKNTSTVIVAF